VESSRAVNEGQKRGLTQAKESHLSQKA